jgi:post-segregation antitoxin (ccd killing protein)
MPKIYRTDGVLTVPISILIPEKYREYCREHDINISAITRNAIEHQMITDSSGNIQPEQVQHTEPQKKGKGKQ